MYVHKLNIMFDKSSNIWTFFCNSDWTSSGWSVFAAIVNRMNNSNSNPSIKECQRASTRETIWQCNNALCDKIWKYWGCGESEDDTKCMQTHYHEHGYWTLMCNNIILLWQKRPSWLHVMYNNVCNTHWPNGMRPQKIHCCIKCTRVIMQTYSFAIINVHLAPSVSLKVFPSVLIYICHVWIWKQDPMNNTTYAIS